MEPAEQQQFEALVDVLKAELRAQFGVRRAHDSDEELRSFAVLLADAVWDRFSVRPRV